MDFNSWINEIIEKTDIVEVINSYISLRRSGGLYSACCPFHSETSPSFFVVPRKQFFNCFGCGKAGNVIKFVQEYERISFMEAAKKLSEKAGIPIPQNTINKKQTSHISAQKYYQITREAAIFYRNNLLNIKDNPAYIYLKKRGFTDKVIKSFGLGYSTNKTALLEHLKSKGYKIEDISEAGLADKDFYKNNYLDPFYERLIIPIITKERNIVGFGSRVLHKYLEEKGKYKNTKETTYFKKSTIIFGLNLVHNEFFSSNSTIKKLDSIYLVEGYMDVMAMHQAGIKNTVASMGTAFTKNQVQAISRYADNVYICFDGDNAGKKATDRSLDEFLKQKINVKIIRIPDNKDPDEYIKEFGKEAFEKLKENALTPIDYQINEASKNHNLNTGDGRNNFIKEALEILNENPFVISPAAYFQNIRDKVNISEEELYIAATNLKNSNVKKKEYKEYEQKSDIMDIQENNILYFYSLFNNDKLHYFDQESNVIILTADSQYNINLMNPTEDEKELQNYYELIKNSPNDKVEFDSVLAFSENEKKALDLYNKLNNSIYSDQSKWPEISRIRKLTDIGDKRLKEFLTKKIEETCKNFLLLDKDEDYYLYSQTSEELTRLKIELENLKNKNIPWDEVKKID